MKRNSPAFTLVEVLVVVAILALLAALLMPALSRAKQQAQATVCRNNLSQIGKALAGYTGDFQKYPGSRGGPIITLPNTLTHWEQVWDRRMLAYVSENRFVFDCPTGQPRHFEPYFSLTNYSYGYNAYGSGVLPPGLNLGLGRAQAPEEVFGPIREITESAVKLPSDMIALGDLNDLPQVFATTIVPNLRLPRPGSPAARHAGGANVLFCDGHIEFAKQEKWIEQTDAARRRWNNDHEPHPETW